ncbi:MAG: IMP dehydrogenase [Flavobacteriales bacterium]|nr:IMP dehydrogenase [Flavobacteriales bacterium]|tara:strand:- start:12647 stop:14107 length:1461 start_codon:yes stop_codon:yes gene_type:complete
MNFDKVLNEGFTFDDVLLVPAYSSCLPSDVSTTSQFSKNIQLSIPVVSAAMDTISESEMAIALSREGGISVIHKNMSVQDQVKQIKNVKRSESGVILNPITLLSDAKASSAKNLMLENNIGGIPILNDRQQLVGIVTKRDLRFEKNLNKSLDKIMTSKGLITAKKGTSLKDAEKILQKNRIEKLPIIDDKDKLIGLITYRDIMKVKEQPKACKDSLGRLRVAAAIGVGEEAIYRAEKLVEVGVDALVIDTAHAHSKLVLDTLKEIKSKISNVDCVVGNIATPSAAKLLISQGADAIKVGIGPGSICTTRIISGVGVPQLTAIYEVSKVANSENVPVIADGGIRFSGDIVKALAGGASSVMLGSLLAGLEESPGETIIYEGRKFKTYRGMGSIDAMQRGSAERYFQSSKNTKKMIPEGIVGRVPFKGKLSEVLFQYIGGLRSGMGYCGAQNLVMLRKSKFTKITNASIHESHPHNVTITKEAPNYSR